MLYIHIPFCRSRCIYCSFFSTVKMGLRRDYADALLRQLTTLGSFSTIYLGGGTPSVLPEESLAALVAECKSHLRESGELTVECNPDDVTATLSSLLYNRGVSRVSLGVQTFDDGRLRFLNRRHTADKAREAVRLLRDAGIRNISIDLMYGFPGETIAQWKDDVREALAVGAEHISAYCLTIEEGTRLYELVQSAECRVQSLELVQSAECRVQSLELVQSAECRVQSATAQPNSALCTLHSALKDDSLHEAMYFHLCRELKAAGYEHYEISNFAKPGCRSRHNSGYWQDKPYTALGAGAHGYTGTLRYWNIADVEEYIRRVGERQSVIEGSEDIGPQTHYNDLITTAMRTSDGLSADYIRQSCGAVYADHFLATARRLASLGLLTAAGGCPSRFRLAPDRLFVSDDILAELIF